MIQKVNRKRTNDNKKEGRMENNRMSIVKKLMEASLNNSSRYEYMMGRIMSKISMVRDEDIDVGILMQVIHQVHQESMNYISVHHRMNSEIYNNIQSGIFFSDTHNLRQDSIDDRPNIPVSRSSSQQRKVYNSKEMSRVVSVVDKRVVGIQQSIEDSISGMNVRCDSVLSVCDILYHHVHRLVGVFEQSRLVIEQYKRKVGMLNGVIDRINSDKRKCEDTIREMADNQFKLESTMHHEDKSLKIDKCVDIIPLVEHVHIQTDPAIKESPMKIVRNEVSTNTDRIIEEDMMNGIRNKLKEQFEKEIRAMKGIIEERDNSIKCLDLSIKSLNSTVKDKNDININLSNLICDKDEAINILQGKVIDLDNTLKNEDLKNKKINEQFRKRYDDIQYVIKTAFRKFEDKYDDINWEFKKRVDELIEKANKVLLLSPSNINKNAKDMYNTKVVRLVEELKRNHNRDLKVLENEIIELKSKIPKEIEKNVEINSQSPVEYGQLFDLQKENKELKSLITKLELMVTPTKHNETLLDNENLREQLRAFVNELVDANTEISKLTEEIDRLKSSYEDHDLMVSKEKGNFNSAQEEIKRLRKENLSLVEQLEEQNRVNNNKGEGKKELLQARLEVKRLKSKSLHND